MGERVRLGDVEGLAGVPAGTEYGLWVGGGGITVVNSGSTVIIDGTSNMFKIAASGTLSGTQATGSEGVVDSITLTGLGTMSQVPAHVSYVAQGSAVTDRRSLGVGTRRSLQYGATTSGGATTADFIAIQSYTRILTRLDASPTGSALVELMIDNHSGASVTDYSKYYVLAEAAM